MSLPPRPNASHEERLTGAMRDLMTGPAPAEIELLSLGAGPLAVGPDGYGVLGLDRSGDVVLVVGVPRLEPGTPAAIADEIDRIARMSDPDLQQMSARPDIDLHAQHSQRFGSTGAPVRLNADQRVVLVTTAEPDEKRWKELVIELGSRLAAIHLLHTDGSLKELRPPAALERPAGGSGWGGSSWLALGAVLLGVGILLLGIARVLLVKETPPPQTLDSPIRVVASEVPADATHGNWIGQRRAVITSQGRVVLVFRSGDGLQLATDQSNRGRLWRAPLTVSDATPSSFAVAIDGSDDLHIALIDDGIPRLMSLHQSRTGWTATEALDLADGSMTSAVIDVAWDVATETGYAIWVQPTDDGDEELRWAAFRTSADTQQIVDEGSLTSSPSDAPILANIAAGGDSTVLVTYRGQEGGWFSRLGRIGENPEAGITWQPEERVPVEGGVGASALVVDTRGTAHLLLRNDAGPRLEYFRRSLRGGWTAPEQVADAGSIEEVDFPALAVDQGSRLVYAFFETKAGDQRQVQVALRDPAGGWEGPYDVAPPAVVPEGSSLPASTGNALGEPIVFWTTGGGSSSVQSARVVAP